MIALSVAALVSAPMVASADGDERDKQEAHGLFLEGIKLYDRGKFAKACAKFEAALELYAGIGTRGKLAECYERMGRVASAWRLYREVYRLAKKGGEKKRAKVAARRAKKLLPSLPQLTINPGPSAVLDGYTIQHNLVEMHPSTFGQRNYVDPGTHLIVVAAYDHKTWKQKVRLKRGQKRKIDVPELEPVVRKNDQLTPKSDSDGSKPEVVKGGSSPVPVGPIDSPGSSGLGGRITGGVAVGLGLVGVGTSLYFGVKARSSWQESQRLCRTDPPLPPGAPCPQIAEQPYLDAKDQAQLGTISFAVGMTVVAAGTLLLWKYSGSSKRQSVSISPALSPGSLGVTLSGRL